VMRAKPLYTARYSGKIPYGYKRRRLTHMTCYVKYQTDIDNGEQRKGRREGGKKNAR
jgi:hypothetical protein